MAFKRMEGFTGSIPQKFADERIPKCPVCKTDHPHWALDQEKGKTFSFDPEQNAHKYLLKCEQCGCIIRTPVTDVVGVGRSSLLSWQGVAKKMRGKDVTAIYVAIVDTGNSSDMEAYKGKEMTLDELNELANR
ncbi:MAG: hypothetical protein LUG13_04525 [Oscillospiraceae bacterium]|nr:hypothetical protein [Oscillospiraceae bacterium]